MVVDSPACPMCSVGKVCEFCSGEGFPVEIDMDDYTKGFEWLEER